MRPILKFVVPAVMLLIAPAAHAQMMGPTWETNVVLTQVDLDMIKGALGTQIHGKKAGTAATWTNPASGNSGSVTLLGISARQGRRCEQSEYRMSSTARPASADRFVLTSCLQADGTWKLS